MKSKRNPEPRRRKPLSWAIVAVFVILFTLRPQPAAAWDVVFDPSVFGQALLTVMHMIWDELETAAGNITRIVAAKLQAEVGIRQTQATVDAIGLMPRQLYTGQTVARYTMQPGSNFCYAIKESEATKQRQVGENYLQGALVSSFEQVGVNGDDNVSRLTMLKGLMDAGLIDCSDPMAGKWLSSTACTTSPYPEFIGQQRSVYSVVAPSMSPSAGIPTGVSILHEVYMPAGVTTDKTTGKLILPKATSVTRLEMPAMVALWHCIIMHRNSTGFNAQNQAGAAAAADYVAYQTNINNANISSGSCLKIVTDSMAVGANATGELAKVYTDQVMQCMYMHKNHKISDAEWAWCQQHGMSKLNAQWHEACKTTFDYANDIAAKGLDNAEMTGKLTAGRGACEEFDKVFNARSAEFIHAEEALAEHQTQAVEGGPVSMQRPVSTSP